MCIDPCWTKCPARSELSAGHLQKSARHVRHVRHISRSLVRHGPKPGSHEAEAFAKLEAEALTLISVPNLLQNRSFGKPRSRIRSRNLWKSRSRSRSQAPKNLGSRSLDPKKAGFVKPKPASAHVWPWCHGVELDYDLWLNAPWLPSFPKNGAAATWHRYRVKTHHVCFCVPTLAG